MPLSEMLDWQEDERARLRILTRGGATDGTFAKDARRYLNDPTVKAMPTDADA